MTGVLVTRKQGLPLYCEFLLAGSGFFNVTPRARVTFQLLRCKGKIQLLMQDASVGTTHSVFFQTQKANKQFWFEWLLFPRNVNSLQANQEDWGLHGAHIPSATPCTAGQPSSGEKGTTFFFVLFVCFIQYFWMFPRLYLLWLYILYVTVCSNAANRVNGGCHR